MTDWLPTKLRDFFFHYDFANPDHKKAVDLLQKHAAQVMNDNAEWVKVFRGAEGDTSYLDTAGKIIAEFEGFRATPYKCPAGVWTIGFGSTYYSDGTIVTPQDTPISRFGAVKLLESHIDNAVVPALERTIPTWGLMNGNQKAAIISFAYNLGAHFYGSPGFNTITKALSTKDNWKQVPSALMLYVNPGSSFEAGLKRRRKAEGDLWMKIT
jgi:GH24 family phage-related lysozyme (muramidase)